MEIEQAVAESSAAGRVLDSARRGTVSSTSSQDVSLYETLNEMLEDDILAGILQPMTHSQKKVDKREIVALVQWCKYSIAAWKDENKQAFRETIQKCASNQLRLEDKITEVLTLFQNEMEKQFDRMAAISAIPLSLVARDQLLVKRLAYDVKATRVSLDMVTNELASITVQEKEALKLKFLKMGAMYERPPTDTVLVGGDTDCPFNEMLHQTLRIERVSFLSPQHYALIKTAEFIGDDIALDKLRKRHPEMA